MAFRLWELSEEIQRLEDAIAAILDDETILDCDREDKIEEAFNQWLALGVNFREKAESVARYIRHQELVAESRKCEAKRLYNLAKQTEAQATRLRRYLSNQMLKTNQTQIEGDTCKLSLRLNPSRVALNCELSEIPSDYLQIKYAPKLLKIKELLLSEAGKDINWASMQPSTHYSLFIR